MSGFIVVVVLLGLRLLSLHNLRFLIELTRGARDAIERGSFAS